MFWIIKEMNRIATFLLLLPNNKSNTTPLHFITKMFETAKTPGFIKLKAPKLFILKSSFTKKISKNQLFSQIKL